MLIISLFILILIIFNYIRIKDTKYINLNKLKQDFNSLETDLYFKGYKLEMDNPENFIVIKRDNIKMYFGLKWIKTEFDDTISLNKTYEISDLAINSQGKFCEKCYYITFKTNKLSNNEELNNFFDFNYIKIDLSVKKTGFPGIDDGFIESFAIFEKEVMSIIELNNYCNEAKSLERYLAYRY